MNGCAHLGSPPQGAKGCPIGEHIPRQVAKVLTLADQAASASLGKITIADLLAETSTALDGLEPHPACTEAIRAAGAVAV